MGYDTTQVSRYERTLVPRKCTSMNGLWYHTSVPIGLRKPKALTIYSNFPYMVKDRIQSDNRSKELFDFWNTHLISKFSNIITSFILVYSFSSSFLLMIFLKFSIELKSCLFGDESRRAWSPYYPILFFVTNAVWSDELYSWKWSHLRKNMSIQYSPISMIRMYVTALICSSRNIISDLPLLEMHIEA